MTDTTQAVGTVAAALAQAGRMLGPRPDLAEIQAREILKVAPGHPEARLLLALAAALAFTGDYAAQTIALGACYAIALLGVDLTALAGALALAWMARATARRVRSGPRDSVWSAPVRRKESE